MSKKILVTGACGWLGSAIVQALLDRGGRWFFNGHMLRRFVDGLEIYRPLEKPKRPD